MHPKTDSATARIMWALWQTSGLTLAQLAQRWPAWPWEALEEVGRGHAG